ncbi:MAG: TonB-dependent receptor [Gemmatimonadaceae bacterium]
MKRAAIALAIVIPIAIASLPGAARAQSLARITGTVTDSVRVKPLVDAIVALVPVGAKAGLIRTAITDARGHFVIDSIAAGRYAVDFAHPLLDTLELTLAAREVVLVEGAQLTVNLAIPSAASLRTAVCPGISLGAGRGALLGQVRFADDDRALPGASVVVAWVDLPTERDIVRLFQNQTGRVVANALGQYRFCDLPTDTWLEIQVQMAGRAGSVVRAMIEDSVGVSLLNLSLASDANMPLVSRDSARRDSLVTSYFAGTATLSGIVRGVEGRPIADAQVRLADAAPVALSDSLGHFQLSGLPAGSQLLEVKRIGYLAMGQNVELRNGEATYRDVRLARVVSLDTMHVISTRLDLRDFEFRSKGGLGHFLRASDIARRGVGDIASLVRQMPGFRVEGRGLDARVYSLQASEVRGLRACRVNVVIDGNQFLEVGLLNPDDVQAMEFYTTGMGAPPQFSSDCGLIIIWTKKRRTPPTAQP